MDSLVCTQCHKAVAASPTSGQRGLRRGLCRACYLRAWRGAALPPNAACQLCDERRAAVLRWTKVGEERIIMCQNCGFLADRLRPRPASAGDLLMRLSRERRQNDRRRNYVIDPEDPKERRAGVSRRRSRRDTASI